MTSPAPSRPHRFHIPIMGTGFSIDTPLRVARYGISSVVSIGDDILIERMREFHCRRLGRDFIAIPDSDEDARAKRITAYLNMINDVVHEQVMALQASAFEPGSEITRYFELLPEDELKREYEKMMSAPYSRDRLLLQESLRPKAVPGAIDVNIMTKLDRDTYRGGQKRPPEFAIAMAALRGFARSTLSSSIILSAGINPRLFNYLAKFDDFLPDPNGVLCKRIVLKVSDFRSALIQGKYLAKRGLWVSEYRIESGLNCGGHAFATDGRVMGPILAEFRRRREEIRLQLHELYARSLDRLGRAVTEAPYPISITVQGGIGTAEENRFLIDNLGADGTGWGTPFLLVPEVTNVDPINLDKLALAEEKDVYLSDHSPVGVPFWSLRTSASEETHRRRIDEGRPGSPCPRGFLASDTEFTDMPICHASRAYQKRKLRQIDASDELPPLIDFKRSGIEAKSCICHDLAGSALLKHGLDNSARPAVCCGPNITNFSKVASLEEMVGHIYGRLSLLTNPDRPHMFIRELSLNVEYLRREIGKVSEGLLDKTTQYFEGWRDNLNGAIEYYKDLAEQFGTEQRERFLADLDKLFEEIENLLPEPPLVPDPAV